MKSVLHAVVGAVAIVALASAPAFAQGSDRGGSGGGGGGGGGHTGVSAPSGGGGGGMSSGSGGSVSGGGGYSGSGGSTSGGFSGGSSGSAGGASPMGGARPSGGVRSERVGRSEAGAAMVRGGNGRNLLAADPRNGAVPGGSRPNYGNPAVGSAVPRGSNSGGNSGSGGYYPDTSSVSPWGYGYGYGYYSPYYAPWLSSYYLRTGNPFYYPYDPSYMYGYGAFGLGSLYYDPLWFGAAMPGGAMPGGWGAMGSEMSSGAGGFSVGGWSSSGGGSSVVKGGLKLKVTPKDAEVYVDGYLVGKAEQYTGAFRRLELPVGAHRVELRAKGYDSVSFEVKIEPRDTQTYRGTMQPLQPVK